MIKTCIPNFIFLVCFADSISLIYDANGNLITGDGKYREYNSLNQLSKVYNGSDTSILLAEFTHHLVEERVLKKVSYNLDGSWKENVYYVDDNFVQVKNSSGTFNYTYIKHEGQIVAQEVNGIKTYIHPDHIGSATVVTNAAGATIENTTYTPYGEVISGGSESRYNYEGKEYDSTLGDTDFHFRKYKAGWAIFLQPDEIIGNAYDSQKLNPYMFEEGNPYSKYDPDGKDAMVVTNKYFKKSSHVFVIIKTNDQYELRSFNERFPASGSSYGEVMDKFYSKFGGRGEYYAPGYFITTPEQDKRMIKTADTLAHRKATEYGVSPSFVCVDYTREVLKSGGINMPRSFMGEWYLSVPGVFFSSFIHNMQAPFDYTRYVANILMEQLSSSVTGDTAGYGGSSGYGGGGGLSLVPGAETEMSPGFEEKAKEVGLL